MNIVGHVKTSLPYITLPRSKAQRQAGKSATRTNYLSTNKLYAGVHRMTRANWATAYHNSSIETVVSPSVASFPLIAYYVFNYKKKRSTSDVSNLSFMGKMIEDSLVIHKVIPDDKIDYISEVRYRYNRVEDLDCDYVDVYFLDDTRLLL